MESAFWERRNEPSEHGVIEYINGVQYVYAYPCDKCVVPDPFPGQKIVINSKRSNKFCEECYYGTCEKHYIQEDMVLKKNHNSDQNFKKKKYWNSKSRRKAERKKEQKLIRKLVAQSDIQND